MSPVSLLLNVIWIVLGGAWMAFAWLVAAVVMAITIVGIPWARAAFNIAAYTLFPFGFTAVSRDALTGQEDLGTGPLGVIGNIIWLVLAGWWLALGHVVTAVLLAVTIIGIPWARAAFNIAAYTLFPFGFTAVSRDAYTGQEDIGTGPLGLIGNIIWLVLAGWWLALGHVITAVLLAVTIIGIPFAWAHLKLAGIALWPIGKIIVPA